MLKNKQLIWLTGAFLAMSTSVTAAKHVIIESVDHAVPHVSTQDANIGEEVILFLRERIGSRLLDRLQDENPHSRRNGPPFRGAVLMVHGGSVPVVPGMDFGYKDYGWAKALAHAGYDVFLLDLTGYGFSPRPRMADPCNVGPANQGPLMPNPLSETCSAVYEFRLNTIAAERDEIDAAIEYIRALRGVEKVSLIGWSGGGQRTGTYTALNPDKVEKLIILASSGYNRNASSDPPAEAPQSGFPFRLQSYEALIFNRWFSNVLCEGQVEAGAETAAWNEIMSFDPLGSTWGTPEWNPVASPAGGLMRVALRTNWGWNAEAAGQVVVPTLIMVGEQDGLFDRNMMLFEDLGTPHRVFLGIACATHFVAWEKQHSVLQDASIAWLNHGRVKGLQHGILSADDTGRISR